MHYTAASRNLKIGTLWSLEMNMAIRPSNWSKTELLLLSYQLKGIKLLSSDLWPRGVFMHRNAAHWIYSLSWIIPRKPHIQSCLAPTTTPHSKSFKSPSLPILILDLNFSRSSLPCLRAYKPQAAADCRFVSTSSWTVPWVEVSWRPWLQKNCVAVQSSEYCLSLGCLKKILILVNLKII